LRCPFSARPPGRDAAGGVRRLRRYPLHLRRWLPERTTADNLRELAFTPGGLLLRDAPDILSEDLDWRGGYERVLTVMAGGARRRSRIAGRARHGSTTPSTGCGGPATYAWCARLGRELTRYPDVRALAPDDLLPGEGRPLSDPPIGRRSERRRQRSDVQHGQPGHRPAGRPDRRP
jgi:hypothetical protein